MLVQFQNQAVRAVAVVATVLMLSSTAGQAAPACGDSDIAITTAFQSAIPGCDHVLCGKVYQPAAGAACPNEGWQPMLAQIKDAQAAHGVVMLGEIHDNPLHHRLRSTLLKGAGSAAFEQIRADQQPGLDRFADFNAHAARLGTADDLLRFLDWDKSAWSHMADYRPLFEAAVAARLPIYAADPARDVMKKAAKEGVAAALPADERTRLGLDQPLGETNDAASLAEIDGSHCGMIPKSAQPNMAQAQRYRDAHMADTLLNAASAHGSAILFAGNGHVRTDRGVPWYIHVRAPDKPVVSVMLIEVEDGKTDPQAYVPRDSDGKPATDFIIFTPRGPDRDKDPCEGMKRPQAK